MFPKKSFPIFRAILVAMASKSLRKGLKVAKNSFLKNFNRGIKNAGFFSRVLTVESSPKKYYQQNSEGNLQFLHF